MSKQWYKALRAWMHPSFMQSVKVENEHARMTLDIRLMDCDGNGNVTTACVTRYVKLASPSGEETIYPLCLQNGEAYLRLEDIECTDLLLTQCDEKGIAFSNGDEFTIMYEVNKQMSQRDEAWIQGVQGNQCVTITNMPSEPLKLHIVKKLVNEFDEELAFQNDMCFVVHIQGCGRSECVELNRENQFHAVVEHLCPGSYEVFEEEQDGMETYFSLDGEKPSQTQRMTLLGGTHTLEVINQKCSGNVLMIDQYIRCGNKELIKPQEQESFRIHVCSQGFDQHYVLNRDNNFSLKLCNVPAGTYDIYSEESCNPVSYLVDAAMESDYARIELCECDSASVLVIEQADVDMQESPLRICKYVRRSDNSLVKPDPQESFKVMLSGCGVCEIFNLNAHNNFCVDIEHICTGNYEVKELNHDGYVAGYIVNDECESTCAKLWIQEGCCNCVTIINEERNKGEVTISKVIRQNDGTLIKPEKNARFFVTLRSFFCKETYVLDNSNDFCVHIHHLKEGSYEIKERKVEGYDTTYMINGGKEENKARFVVMNDRCSDIKIINTMKREICGDLRICKFIANAYGDYVKPSADEEFEIHVEGPCLDVCYTLRAANSWCILLEGLKKGVYRIQERKQSHYDTQYFVNGNEQGEEALVCMERQNQEVVIVNTKRSYGNLKLNIMVEDCDRCLQKPRMTEYFDVIVETCEGSKEYRFDERNNFGMVLENLPRGKVRVIQKDSYGYRVLYDVRHHRGNHASVTMDGTNEEVTIVNQMMNCSGVVRIRKLVKTLHGRIIRPCEEDCYSFCLRSRCLNHEFTLQEQNHFSVMFDDLEEGHYELKEQPADGMETSYRINGVEKENGCFDLERDDVEIEVINTVLPLPKLTVQKRIRKHGMLIKPQEYETFHFQLIGKGVHETYCLKQENDWCVVLDDLDLQHYEIREINDNGCVAYLIDDTLCEKGTFLFGQKDMEITIVNEVCSDALVRISAMMRDQNGCIRKPCGEKRFEAVLESACYKQCFSLEKRNHWCVEIEGLAEGEYTLYERDTDTCDILIDGKSGNTFRLGQEDVDVTMVNSCGCENALIISANLLKQEEIFQPDPDKVYHIHVEHEGKCECFTLDCENHWCIELANICLGDYRIYADEEVLYEACDQWFTCGIDIEMGCGEICVNLFEEACFEQSITIQKRIQDENGELRRPCAHTSILLCSHMEECFELNESNDWTICLRDYLCGDYEVIDMSCDQVIYQINGERRKNGCFTLNGQSVNVSILSSDVSSCSSQETIGGQLSVHAMVRNGDGELESADADAAFAVQIDGRKVQEDITLTQRNGFLMMFDHLDKGTYVISQLPNQSYGKVTYRVNGKEQADGRIQLGEENIQVDLINERNAACGNIYVMCYDKDDTCGCLKRPCMEETYEIVLEGNGVTHRGVLNEENRWSYLFDKLSQGVYTLYEPRGKNVTYMVNGGKEQEQARIEISGNKANVKVIHALSNAAYGSLELCKYVQDEAGKIQMPSAQESFWISVIGANDTHRILLHAANHFYAELCHLPSGTYEVMEENDEQAYYVVNGKQCEKGIVKVNANRNSVDIVNVGKMRTAIALSKMIQETDGTLRPADSGEYRIHISAPGYNRIITLNEENAYHAIVDDIQKGLYVIDELDHSDVSYQIDGGSQVDRAIVNVQGTHEVVVINTNHRSKGRIKLTKYIRKEAGLLLRPSGTDTYVFHVSKPGYSQMVTLDQHNHWTLTLSDLADGNYVIQEMDQEHVSYIINDGSECDFGIVPVAGNDNSVSIINAQTAGGSIAITKYIRDDEGALHLPNGDYQVKVHVSKSGYHELLTLNRDNGWHAELHDLDDGDYALDEINHEEEVTWRINGGYEVNYAIVKVAQNENQVDMINTQRQSQNGLELVKYVKKANGGLMRPADGDRFRIEISGDDFQQMITLDQSNQFQASVVNLADGTYTIREIGTAGYITTYRVNGAMESQNASITVADGKNNVVEIMNELRQNQNVVHVFKYIADHDNTFHKPNPNQVFRFLLTGNNMHQFYTLNAQNDWHVLIDTLASGEYEIIEQSSGAYDVQYLVDGSDFSATAEFTTSAGSDHTVEIINRMRRETNGTIVLEKKLRNENGELVNPANKEGFMIRIHSDAIGYDQSFTLDSLNGYTLTISDLAYGTYQIEEIDTGGYGVTYIVNSAKETSNAIVQVENDSNNQVTIINTKTELFFHVNESDNLQVVIE